MQRNKNEKKANEKMWEKMQTEGKMRRNVGGETKEMKHMEKKE